MPPFSHAIFLELLERLAFNQLYQLCQKLSDILFNIAMSSLAFLWDHLLRFNLELMM